MKCLEGNCRQWAVLFSSIKVKLQGILETKKGRVSQSTKASAVVTLTASGDPRSRKGGVKLKVK